MKKRELILGPPGTGKTTSLMDIMEREMNNGVSPQRIAFVSFTRKAAHEAASRAMDLFNLKRAYLPYFKTLHSLAFQIHGLRRDEVLQGKNLREIGDLLGLTFSYRTEIEDGLPTSSNRGDRYLFLDGYSRARCIPPEAAWRTLNDAEELNWMEFKRFREVLGDYKKKRGLMDFADMLVGCHPLDVEVAILDEAQDCSSAQWKMFWEVFGRAKRIYVAGDDDQAIYAWAGADVETFQNLKGFNRTVLHKSHRVPAEVHKVASSIAERIAHRYPKEYKPKLDRGLVEFCRQPDDVNLKDIEGTWLLLSRNAYYLKELVAMVRSQGIPYSYRGEPGINQDHVRAIKFWERQRRGGSLAPDEVRSVREFLPKGAPFSQLIWHEALTKIPFADREFYISLLRSGESLTAIPRVNISTIHGVKGGEADNVLMLTDMTPKTMETYSVDPDNEHRVFYVGATRTKERLFVVEPMTGRGYDV